MILPFITGYTVVILVFAGQGPSLLSRMGIVGFRKRSVVLFQAFMGVYGGWIRKTQRRAGWSGGR